MTQYTGVCVGGPWSGNQLTHYFAPDTAPVFMLAIDMDDPYKKAIPAQQAATKSRNVKFGRYVFVGDAWAWDQSQIFAADAPESVHN